MGKLQEILTKTMQQAGSFVEKIAEVAGKKKTTKPKRTLVTDEKGQDFGAITWEESQIHSLLSAAERRELFPLLPDLAEKKSLHLTPAQTEYVELMGRRGAQDIVELDVRRASVSTEAPQPHVHPYARGAVDKLPLKSDTFDFILYPSALAWRMDLLAMISEAGRCAKSNARLLISTVHPFFEYLMNPRGGFRKNINSIYQQMKKSGFFVDELREGVLEDAMKNVSLPTHLTQELLRFPGLPVVLLIRGIYVRKRKAQ